MKQKWNQWQKNKIMSNWFDLKFTVGPSMISFCCLWCEIILTVDFHVTKKEDLSYPTAKRSKGAHYTILHSVMYTLHTIIMMLSCLMLTKEYLVCNQLLGTPNFPRTFMLFFFHTTLQKGFTANQNFSHQSMKYSLM